MKLEKTDKSFTEMEVDLNQQYDWSKITEAGKKLKRISGPDLIGLKNLGNSCYMNSVIQVLFHLPEVRGRYLSAAELLFLSSPEPPIDLLTQLGKLAVALCTERYAIPATTAEDEVQYVVLFWMRDVQRTGIYIVA
jgi:ubiquitin carboxyl-terminal hydrolase 5/13